jgi:murein DD-endopeptidase MepM/ murein hydrolase activator NlpD
MGASRSAVWPQVVAIALMGMGAAGCADSSRFSDFSDRPPPRGEVTGSVAQNSGRVESRALPHLASDTGEGMSGGGRGMGSYQPGGDVTGSLPPAPPPPTFTWEGGTPIVVARGDTLETLSHRYGVPVSAIMEANNLASPHAIQAGQRLVIPRYIHSLSAGTTVAVLPAHPAPSTAKPTSAPPAAAPPPTVSASPAGHAAAPANSEMHVVAAGDTLSKIARHYGRTLPALAKANNIQPNAKLNIGDRILIPGARVGRAKTESEPNAAPASKPDGKETAAVVTPSPAAPNPAVPGKAAAEAMPLRWPVHGKVIAAFGSKSNGQPNDGIDVAVPENTPVKAADDGVVAYAGNELKGYGNLVLVRHPNGYVTAYAHAKELLVKKGDPIKRGQVIAKSGQTGNVEVPELHFEVRKGTAAIDPMQFLGGA